ncbi:MAG: hypothetical protein FJZ01_26960 [Candidatus Sericytochromatia bacterium]|nr:hypothetical protein [Candidatus Tanganyikabacteria bacterium]
MGSEIGDVLVSSLGLTKLAIEVLSLHGYRCVADLQGASRADLLRVMGIAEPTVLAIEKALGRLGLDPHAVLSGSRPPRLPPCLDSALREGPIGILAALEKFLKDRELDALVRRLARAETFEAIARTWNANPERARQVVARACLRARYLLNRDETWFAAISRVDEIVTANNLAPRPSKNRAPRQ